MPSHQHTSLRRFGAALALGIVALTSSACRSSPDALPLGQPVDTTFYSLLEGEKQGTGTVAVTAVRDGELADLAAAGFDIDVDGITRPLYVDVRFTNAGEVPVDLREPSGIDADDNLVPSLTVLEIGETATYEACPALPDNLDPGGTVAGCSIVLVPDGAQIARISYLSDVSEDFVYWTVS